MLRGLAIRTLFSKSLPSQLAFVQKSRSYSVKPDDDFDAARQWYLIFNKNTIPESISTTKFSRASGAGGQKVNKTSSKATTTWAMSSLETHIPKVLLRGLREGRYHVSSSDSIQIQCDSYRSQGDNKAETFRRLHGEIKEIYNRDVPGVTPPAQVAKIEQLEGVLARYHKVNPKEWKDPRGLREELTQLKNEKKKLARVGAMEQALEARGAAPEKSRLARMETRKK